MWSLVPLAYSRERWVDTVRKILLICKNCLSSERVVRENSGPIKLNGDFFCNPRQVVVANADDSQRKLRVVSLR